MSENVCLLIFSLLTTNTVHRMHRNMSSLRAILYQYDLDDFKCIASLFLCVNEYSATPHFSETIIH